MYNTCMYFLFLCFKEGEKKEEGEKTEEKSGEGETSSEIVKKVPEKGEGNVATAAAAALAAAAVKAKVSDVIY